MTHHLDVGGSGEFEARSRQAPALVAAALVAAGVAAAVGAALLVVGIMALVHASDTRARAAHLRRDRPPVVARTRAAEHDADAPIGRAENVTASVSAIVEASDTVISTSATASGVFSRAVGLANDGNIGAAHQLYTGEGAESIAQLTENLARARAALAAAQRAIADFEGTPP